MGGIAGNMETPAQPSINSSNKFNLYLTTKKSASTEPIPNLYGGGGRLLNDVGELMVAQDSRYETITLVSDLLSGTNTSYSYNPAEMSCNCCGKFLQVKGGKNGARIWVITDQNFSPCLPNSNGMGCMKIVRIEYGCLPHMVSKFLLKNSQGVGGRDMILLGSATQLLREGVAGYVESFLDAEDRLAAGSRKDCLILPAPFVLLGGCNEQSLIKNIFDFHAWVRISGADPEGILNDAMGVIEHYLKNGKSEKLNWPTTHYKLPLGIPNRTKTATYCEGPANLPKGADPVTEQVEKLILTSLLSSLNEKYARLGYTLDCDPLIISSQANSTKECRNIIVMGGDHAEATAAELQKKGAKVQLLHIPSYRHSQVHAGKLKEGLDKLELKEDTWLVVQVFDSGLYMAAPADGGLIPPCMRADGKIHVDGDQVLLPKDMQYQFFKQLDAELTAVKHLKTTVSSWLPSPATCWNPAAATRTMWET
jgi:hypothetical protein